MPTAASRQPNSAVGMVCNKKGLNERAIADCSAAIALDPRNAAPYLIRGLAYLAKGDPQQSDADLKKAAALSGGSR
jgi:Flp pilus assembly protein TadD